MEDRRKFRFTRKTGLVLLAVLLGIAAQAILFNFVLKTGPNQVIPEEQDLFAVTAQDLSFDIDVENQVFRSSQVFSLKNSEISRRSMVFMIHPSLAIDRIEFSDAQGLPQVIAEWHVDRPVEYPRWYGTAVFNIVSVQFSQAIAPRQSLILHLDYHLKPGGFQSGLGKNLYEFFVSHATQHAVGFDSGAFAVMAADGAAPLKMTMRYPENEQCAVPGDPLSSQTSDGFVTSTYQVAQAYDPAFSCAVYQKKQASQDGLTVEFYVIPGEVYSERMSAIALRYLTLYRQLFGSPGTDTFRFIFVPLDFESGGGGESKGNAVYLGKTSTFDYFDQDEDEQSVFMSLAGHEGFHNWNTFYDGWSGKYAEWWSEGGANFMNTWASERLWGPDSARAIRTSYLESFDHEMGYRSPGTLEYPNSIWKSSTWKGEWTLIYQYGALVWEQLRQKIGSETLAAGLHDFIQQSAGQHGNFDELVRCLERYTDVDVAAYLAQWTTHNAQLDFSILSATTRKTGDQYETTVRVNLESDRDYEIITALGYKTSSSRDWELVPLHVTAHGDTLLTFTSRDEPLEFLVDPDRRVPQTNIHNDHWPLAPN